MQVIMTVMRKVAAFLLTSFSIIVLTACKPSTSRSISPTITLSVSGITETFTNKSAQPTEKGNNRAVTSSISPTNTATESPTLRFAIVGDYGDGNNAEKKVADLILSWKPDLILTTGDNNYPKGSGETIDKNIGQYFHAYIHPYLGIYGQGADKNRFYPSLGNHDWISSNAQPYLDYFQLPGNERYYQVQKGLVDFFILDSDGHEPDGVDESSVQAEWLRSALSSSIASWKVVCFHHPPYSSALHGSALWMRWPFQEWGADLVLSGHDHTYERLLVDNLTYIVNGLGGANIYNFDNVLPESQVRYNQDHGAMLVTASAQELHIQFIRWNGEIIDDFSLTTGNQ